MKRMVSSARIDRARVVPVWVLFPLLRKMLSEGDEDEGPYGPFSCSCIVLKYGWQKPDL